MRIIFIEGVPGSGKSTLAESICDAAIRAGYDAKWYLEEAHNHPVHPKTLCSLKSQQDFAEVCLQSWANFVEQCQGNKTLHILEGSAFQSTVRFMMEAMLPDIERYFLRFEAIVRPLSPRMVYLRPQNIEQHSAAVSILRGNEWATKVSGYLQNTRYSLYHGIRGLDGMHRFWTDYAKLCDRLVESTALPAATISVAFREWGKSLPEALDFLEL